jgi:methionyl aminopeptidase
MIILKSKHELQHMRRAGLIVAETHELLKENIKPGITTEELDSIAEEYIRKCGANPSFKGYRGFPASICASVNDEVVHGIPNERELREGDIISVDIGAEYKGYHGDAARTYPVGAISEQAASLIEVTKQSFFEGIRYAVEKQRLSDISAAVQKHVESNGYSVVKEFVGHGIGQKMHEEPQIPNYGKPGRGPRLLRGMTLAIEPMVNMGTGDVKVLTNGWTVVTLDGSLSAHYENTIVITDGKPKILTFI